ncbi:MAG: hypothetical protein EBW95_07775, partial [Burkholderiaceae bacterium]|nr:hypothetical protein [Burkholderiaceae bacterium]
MALPQTPDPNSTDYIDDEDFIALEIPDAWAGERLDKVLAHFLTDYSRNRIQSWANQGAVLVDGKVVKEFKPEVVDTVKAEQSTWDFLHRALHMVTTRGTAAGVFSGFPVAVSVSIFASVP